MKNPGYILWQASNSWQRMQREALENLGLTHVQFMLLKELSDLELNDESVSQRRLALHAKTDPMMTSQVVRSLERKGFLIRSDNAQDSRALKLTTTAQGRETVNKALKIVEEVDHKFFGHLSPKFIEDLKQLIHE